MEIHLTLVYMAKLEKIFLIGSVFCLMSFSASAHNDEPDQLISKVSADGVAVMTEAQRFKLDHQPRHEEIQAFAVSTQKDTVWGPLRAVYKDGFSVGITTGMSYFTKHGAPALMQNVQPELGVSFCHDGIFGWHKKDGTPVHPFAYELNISALTRHYELSSTKSDKIYVSYKTTGYFKYRIFEDKWQRSRLNLVGSVGYMFSRDEALITRQEEADGYKFTATFNPYYTGSGLTYGGGLEYRYQFPLRIKKDGKTNAAAGDGLTAKLIVEGAPIVEYNLHYHVPTIRLTLSYTFGINRWIVR